MATSLTHLRTKTDLSVADPDWHKDQTVPPDSVLKTMPYSESSTVMAFFRLNDVGGARLSLDGVTAKLRLILVDEDQGLIGGSEEARSVNLWKPSYLGPIPAGCKVTVQIGALSGSPVEASSLDVWLAPTKP